MYFVLVCECQFKCGSYEGNSDAALSSTISLKDSAATEAGSRSSSICNVTYGEFNTAEFACVHASTRAHLHSQTDTLLFGV